MASKKGSSSTRKAPKKTATLIKPTSPKKAVSPDVSDEPSLKTMKEISMKDKPVSLVLWTETESETPFSPSLSQHLARSLTMKKQATHLMERMRHAAQPNEAFRGQRLVAGDVGEVSDRTKFITVLTECKEACFGDQAGLIGYVNDLIALEMEAEKAQDTFLRQVMLYCVMPLRTFVEQEYPSIVREHDHLEKKRKAYDDERRKRGPVTLATTTTSEGETKVSRARQELSDQAGTVERMFDNAPKNQMAFARAISTFIMAEMSYQDKIHQSTNALKPPTHASRWKDAAK